MIRIFLRKIWQWRKRRTIKNGKFNDRLNRILRRWKKKLLKAKANIDRKWTKSKRRTNDENEKETCHKLANENDREMKSYLPNYYVMCNEMWAYMCALFVAGDRIKWINKTKLEASVHVYRQIRYFVFFLLSSTAAKLAFYWYVWRFFAWKSASYSAKTHVRSTTVSSREKKTQKKEKKSENLKKEKQNNDSCYEWIFFILHSTATKAEWANGNETRQKNSHIHRMETRMKQKPRPKKRTQNGERKLQQMQTIKMQSWFDTFDTNASCVFVPQFVREWFIWFRNEYTWTMERTNECHCASQM